MTYVTRSPLWEVQMYKAQQRHKLSDRPLTLWVRATALLLLLALGNAMAQNQDTTLDVLVPAEFPDIDTCETVSGDQSMVKYHVYSRLFTFNEGMEPEPDLVVGESITPSKFNSVHLPEPDGPTNATISSRCGTQLALQHCGNESFVWGRRFDRSRSRQDFRLPV